MPPTLPDPTTAYNNLFSGVYQQTALDTLASRGYVPKTAKEAADLLNIVSQVATATENADVKQAEDLNNPYFLASQGLAQVLGNNGIHDPVKAAADRNRSLAIQRYAANLMQEPVIYNSVLSLKAAEARQAAEALQIPLP